MKTLVIEWHRLLDEQEKTCPRCASTEQELEKAVAHVQMVLNATGIGVVLTKLSIDGEHFKENALQSNRVLIAGKPLEDWLGASTGQSRCCDVCGDAECRTVEYADQTHEAIPADLIVKAALLAASQLFHTAMPQSDQYRPTLTRLRKKHKL